MSKSIFLASALLPDGCWGKSAGWDACHVRMEGTVDQCPNDLCLSLFVTLSLSLSLAFCLSVVLSFRLSLFIMTYTCMRMRARTHTHTNTPWAVPWHRLAQQNCGGA